MKVRLKHPSGFQKETKAGFSWTVFFFAFFPPLFRGDWKWAIIILLLAPFTLGLSTIIFAFIYNGIYIRALLRAGYVAADEESKYVLVRKGYIAA